MGITLSTASAINPLSFASTVIGFVSFALTLSNWLKLFHNSIITLFQAESEIHAYLGRLRIELWEEKASLRRLRQHNKDFSRTQHGTVKEQLKIDDYTLQNMQDVIERLTTRFKTLEEPFLELPHQPHKILKKRHRIDDTYTRESGWEDDHKQSKQSIQSIIPSPQSTREDLNDNDDETDENDCDRDSLWSGNDYCNITISKRFAWLKHRPEAVKLTESLTRVQTRRIARQVGEISLALYQYSNTVQGVKHQIESINVELGRIVSIRRVES